MMVFVHFISLVLTTFFAIVGGYHVGRYLGRSTRKKPTPTMTSFASLTVEDQVKQLAEFTVKLRQIAPKDCMLIVGMCWDDSNKGSLSNWLCTDDKVRLPEALESAADGIRRCQREMVQRN